MTDVAAFNAHLKQAADKLDRMRETINRVCGRPNEATAQELLQALQECRGVGQDVHNACVVARATKPAPHFNGLLCIICETPQFDTPHGATCANGHGGADGIDPKER